MMRLFFTYVVLLFAFSASGQIGFEGSIPIIDEDTTTVGIVIQGLENDNLATNNCLLAVDINFRHDYLSDLQVFLESPSGQTVELVGPVGTLSDNTQFITWDISFFADSESAIPDGGYEVIWNNIQNWFKPRTYIGSYYPHNGSLEDIDMGPANGEWLLHIVDQVDFFEGEINKFQLVFCDTTGATYLGCLPGLHNLDEVNQVLCQGDDLLDFDITPEVIDPYDSTFYDYTYLVFKDGGHYETADTVNLIDAESGLYTICGLSYFISDTDDLSLLSTEDSIQTLEESFAEYSICGGISESCFTVEILDIPEVITEPITLCEGDTVTINNVDYTTTGIYEIVNPQLPCDSISYLDLTINNIDIFFSTPIPVISCENDTLTISAEDTEIPIENAMLKWSTHDGEIIGVDTTDIVSIARPGTYTLEIFYDGCLHVDSLTINADPDFLYIETFSEPLTCINDEVLIDINPSTPLDTIVWEGTSDFSIVGEDILVSQGGTYTYTATNEAGCIKTRSIIIEDERIFPDFTLQAGVLTCTRPATNISFVEEDIYNSSYAWFSNTGFISSEPFVQVDKAGIYRVEVTTELGCKDTFEILIITEVVEIDVTLLADTLTCNKEFVTVSYSSSYSDLDALWTLPSGDIRVDSFFNTSEIGTFRLYLVDENNCFVDTTMQVVLDQNEPDINITGGSFTCDADSVLLSATSNFSGVSYLWTGQGGIQSNEDSIYVFSPGTYYLEMCRPNGCCSLDSIFVGTDIDAPMIDFEYGDLDCYNDTIYIIPDDTSTYELTWFLNNIPFDPPNDVVEVTQAGIYNVIATVPETGCTSNYLFNIKADFVDTLKNIEADILNCDNDVVTLFTETNKEVIDFSWSGPGLLDNNFSPLVDEPGEYIISYTMVNGCESSDTINVIREKEIPNLDGEDAIYNCMNPTTPITVTHDATSINISWQGPNGNAGSGETINAPEPGVYTAFAVAIGNCRDTFTITVVADTIPPTVSLVGDGSVSCTDSLVTLTGTIDEAESYMFTGPSVVAQTDLEAIVNKQGEYTLTAIAENGCEETATVFIENTIDFPDYEIVIDTLDCVNSSVNVGFSSNDPALDITWTGPIAIANDTYTFDTDLTGNYTFSAINDLDCRVIDSFKVVRDTMAPEGFINMSNNLTCTFADATFSVDSLQPSWILEWDGPGVTNPNATTFTTDMIGAYSLNITARNGCETDRMITLVYDTIPPTISLEGGPINCESSKANLKVITDLPIVSYHWEGPNDYVNNEAEPLAIESGEYYVTVTGVNGCETRDSYALEDIRIYPTLDISDAYLPCDGAPAVITYDDVSSDFDPPLIWFGPDNYYFEGDTASILVEGEYVAIGFNEDGCSTSDTILIINEPVYPIFDIETGNLYCSAPATLEGIEIDDDRSFFWVNDEGFYEETNPTFAEEPGTYTLVVTGVNGCVDSMDVFIADERIYPNATTGINEPFQCDKVSARLTGEGSSEGSDFTYVWTTEDGNILEDEHTLSPFIDGEGMYILSVTNEVNGCISYDTLDLMQTPADFQGVGLDVTPPTCKDFGNAIIEITEFDGGFPPYQVFVDDEDYGNRMDVPYLIAGEHELILIDSLGCVFDSLVTITDTNTLSVILPMDTTICFGDTITIRPEVMTEVSYNVIWDPFCDSCDVLTLMPSVNETVTITVIDENGCEVVTNMNITVTREPRIPFPNIFSPNGDNVNDIFYLPMTKGIQSIDLLKVYDTWGNILFESKDAIPGDPSYGWDGNIRGDEVGQGVYLFEAYVTMTNGEEVVQAGTITVVR